MNPTPVLTVFLGMKTYILRVPDAANEAAVQTALAGLLAQHLIVLEPDVNDLFDPVSEAEFAAEVRAALAAPVLSATEARTYLGL